MDAISNLNKYLSQRDPAWANVKLGDSNLTVGRYGCTTTCISMLTEYFGCYQDPGQVAQTLSNYVGGNVNWISLNFPTFSFRWREGDLYSFAQNLDMDLIKAYMYEYGKPSPDKAVILEVANHSHWVVALWPTADGQDFVVIDPWTGTTCNVLETYKNITGASCFVRWDKTKHNGQQAWQGQGKPVAPLYN